MNHPFKTRMRVAKTPVPVIAVALALLAAAVLFPSLLLAQEPVDQPPPAVMDYVPQERPLDETGGAVEAEAAETTTEAVTVAPAAPIDTSALATKIYLPLLDNDSNMRMADRMGFGLNYAGSLNDFPAARGLNAGWYQNWAVRSRPARPYGMEFVQTVRVHQKIDSRNMYDADTRCGNSVTADRTICPYTVPHRYEMVPSAATIRDAAEKNPGSIWVIGNEMERSDWGGGRMDEILPQLYAVAYHDIYRIIKAADPTAQVAIGGVIQFTPLRRQYLDIVWNTYKAKYKTDMPVDVWNVHNFIGAEYCVTEKVAETNRNEYVCYGMGVPVGMTIGSDQPSYIQRDNLHIDMATFERQIRDFRAWMKAKGQMNKPLIVTEYGVLYQSICAQTDGTKKRECIDKYNKEYGGYVDLENPAVVHRFMLDTFAFFANAKDPNLSGVNGGELVQMWAWFSLTEQRDSSGTIYHNPYTSLMTFDSRQLKEAGKLYRTYANNHWAVLANE